MRAETDKSKVEKFMLELGKRVGGKGTVFLAGGATAVLRGWRATTIDVDIKPDPEPPGLFEALAILKDELDINVEIASPDQFIPPIPGWRERSLFVAKHGPVEFLHYDPYGQALSKLQRGHDRDLHDVQSLLKSGWIEKSRLWEMYQQIEPQLLRYPAIDAPTFRSTVKKFCDASG